MYTILHKLILAFICLPLFSVAQRQGNIWYFAGNGIDFNSGSAILLSDGEIQSLGYIEGTATISDSAGNLLFYATAKNIWNRNHQYMQNGTGLMGDNSSTQGVFIVPLPDSDSIFYVFTLDGLQQCFENGLRYSIVNMCLDDGLGGIENSNKNILLLDSAGEKMAGTFHANGTDIWLVVHKYFSDAFYAYLVTSNGIADTVISHIGSHHPADSSADCDQAIGQMKISPDGSEIAVVNGNTSTNAIAELFDFDNTTGIVSNLTDLEPDTSLLHYGVAFSPDNSKLYITKSTGINEVYQYDLSSGIPATIIASRTSLHSTGSPLVGMQLAPDGKIYIASSTHLDVISSPNSAGLACGYTSPGFSLNNVVPYSLPNFIDSYAYKNEVFDCDTLVLEATIESYTPACIGECSGSANVHAEHGDEPYIYLWSNAATTSTISGLCAGTYTVEVTDAADSSVTVSVTINEGLDIPLTVTQNYDTLTATTAPNYQWYYNDTLIPGANSQYYVIIESGNYYVVTTSGGCTFTSNLVETVCVCNAIGEYDFSNSVFLYPNPASSTLTINTGLKLNNTVLKIMNKQGQLIHQTTTNRIDKLTLDISQYPSGLYYLTLQSNKGIAVKKFEVIN